MEQILLVFHVMFALGIIGLVLLQRGKGAEAGAAFGSGASSTVFGARGSTSFLSKLTTTLAALFFASSLGLATLAANRGGPSDSVTDIGGPPAASAESEPAMQSEPDAESEQLDVPKVE